MTTTGVPGFRDTFRRYLTRWLANRPSQNVGYRFLYAMIFPLDYAMQAIVEGIRAKFPGLGTPSALYLIGQSRGLLQGEAETDAAFAERTIPWIDDWTQSNVFATERLAREIQAYLANGPAVTIVDRSGKWMVLTSVADGSVASLVTAPWNWDGTSNPERAGIWSDLWIIIYPCEWTEAPTVSARSSDDTHVTGYGIGHLVGRTAVDAILSLVALWKGGYTSVRAIVWSYDATLCVPNGTNNPDGNWGEFSKISGGPFGTRVPARSDSARYWTPTTL